MGNITEPVKLVGYLPPRWFPSLESAVLDAMSHPRLVEARRDAAQLDGSTFVDASWTWSEWILRFDCGLSLHIWIEEPELRWALKPSETIPTTTAFEHVGAPRVTVDWVNTIGVLELDRSTLVAKRRGARFKDLFVGQRGIFLYLSDCLILNFILARRLSDAQVVISVFEDD